jgi:Phospholipase_D-nuclease N-terminal
LAFQLPERVVEFISDIAARSRHRPVVVGNSSRPLGHTASASVSRRRSVHVLAADWTFGDFLLAVLDIFGWVVLFWLIITVFTDLFRRHDVSGWVKTFWVIFVIVFPFLGVLVYLVTQHAGMAQRSDRAAGEARDELRRVVGFSAADELEKLERMKIEGRLSEEEYRRLRDRIVQS